MKFISNFIAILGLCFLASCLGTKNIASNSQKMSAGQSSSSSSNNNAKDNKQNQQKQQNQQNKNTPQENEKNPSSSGDSGYGDLGGTIIDSGDSSKNNNNSNNNNSNNNNSNNNNSNNNNSNNNNSNNNNSNNNNSNNNNSKNNNSNSSSDNNNGNSNNSSNKSNNNNNSSNNNSGSNGNSSAGGNTGSGSSPAVCQPRTDLTSTACTSNQTKTGVYTVTKGTLTNNCGKKNVIRYCQDNNCGKKFYTNWFDQSTNKEVTFYTTCTKKTDYPCTDENGLAYKVGERVYSENLYYTDFCSKKQGCNYPFDYICQKDGSTKKTTYGYQSPMFNKTERIVLPDEVTVLDTTLSNDIYKILGCGPYIVFVMQAEVKDRDGTIRPGHNLYIVIQNNVHLLGGTYADTDIMHIFDGLTCVDQRYLAGSSRYGIATLGINYSLSTNMFFWDLKRFGYSNGRKSVSSWGGDRTIHGFGNSFVNNVSYRPNFRDQDSMKVAAINDIQFNTVKIVRGNNIIYPIYLGDDTTMYVGAAALQSSGTFADENLPYHHFQIDPQYVRNDKYYGTSIFDLGDKSGTFYALKKKVNQEEPFLYRCKVSLDNLDCTALETKNLSGNSQTNFTFLNIEGKPYIMAWNTSTKKVLKIYEFKDNDNVFDASGTALANANFKNIESLAAVLVSESISNGQHYNFLKDNKVWRLKFNAQKQLITQALTQQEVLNDPELTNYSYLYDLTQYVKTLKDELGDTSPLIAGKGTKADYYIPLKPKNYDNIIFVAEPKAFAKLKGISTWKPQK